MKKLSAPLAVLFLVSSALAGGAGPRPTTGELTRHAALQAIPGVTVTQAPPFDGATVLSAAQQRQKAAYYSQRDGIYTVNVRVGGQQVPVQVSPSFLASAVNDGKAALNVVQVNVPNPAPTPAQREAMVRVALGVFNVCRPDQAQALTDPFWQARLTQPWRTWQETQVGTLKAGWRGEADAGATAAQRKHYVGSLDVRWTGTGGRCKF